MFRSGAWGCGILSVSCVTMLFYAAIISPHVMVIVGNLVLACYIVHLARTSEYAVRKEFLGHGAGVVLVACRSRLHARPLPACMDGWGLTLASVG